MLLMVQLMILWCRGAQVFDVQEARPFIVQESPPNGLGASNWIEFGVSLSSSLVACGLLANATFLGSGCVHLDDCSSIDEAIEFMKYSVMAWIAGKIIQSVMGCCTVSESRIIRPVMLMISTIFLWAMSMIIAGQVHVPIGAGFAFLWLGLIALEASDLAIILTKNNCCKVSYEPSQYLD